MLTRMSLITKFSVESMLMICTEKLVVLSSMCSLRARDLRYLHMDGSFYIIGPHTMMMLIHSKSSG
jgi:hypothetical protein